jgi:flagellar hook-associated protein 3 FlgL
MRITQGMVNAQIQRGIDAAFAALARQQELVSSGKRILAPSDDPGGAAQTLVLRSREAATAQFQKNVAAATAALSTADTTLGSIAETLTQAREAAVQGASDSNDALARKSIGSTVNQLLETLVSLANGRSGAGTFLFGGQESTTAPYRVTRDASGQITAVTPNPRGIDAQTPAEVSENVTVSTTVSGTAVFGPATDPTYAFDVLIRLRDHLNGQHLLSFQPDVSAAGTPNASAYVGIASPTDLQIGGPTGSATVAATAAADDALSYSGNASSAIAAAAKINLLTLATGVTATATKAQVSYTAGSFAGDITLDGTAGKKLVINGTPILGAVSGASPTARRDALVARINAQTGATGVVASAIAGSGGFALTAPDGRNISIETDGTVTPASVNATFFGFATGLTGTGAATSVVARGGVQLSASGPVTVTPAAGSGLSAQMSGQGTTGIQAALDALGGTLDRVVVPQTLVGTRLAWVALLNDRLQTDSLGVTTEISHIEDLDIAKAATFLQQLQTTYEGSLASAARLAQVSLLDFLR